MFGIDIAYLRYLFIHILMTSRTLSQWFVYSNVLFYKDVLTLDVHLVSYTKGNECDTQLTGRRD